MTVALEIPSSAPRLTPRDRQSSVPLHESYSRARGTWTDISLTFAEFETHLARVGACEPACAHAEELYICAACALGRERAVEAIEARYFPAVVKAIQRLLRNRAAVDEVLQDVRTRLFVGRAPRIASYRGAGSLSGWLRCVGVRAAQDHLRANKVERCGVRRFRGECCLVASDIARDQASESWAQRVVGARRCQQAWLTAVRGLGTAERQLLHHYFVSGFSIDVLGALYAVHRATVARRIHRATARLRRDVHAALADAYCGVSPEELDALAFDVCSHLDLSGALLTSEESPLPH